MRYKVNVNLQATASLELDAASPEAARLAAAELTLPDLARKGMADILSLKITAKEITPMASLSGEDEATVDGGRPKARPSGWYRPL